MSIGLLGFAKGAAGTALDSITAREESEREKKKEEARLRLIAELDAAEKALIIKDYEEDEDTRVGVNAYGQKVESTRTPLTQAQKDKRKRDAVMAELDEKEKRLGLENTRDLMQDRRLRRAQEDRRLNSIEARARGSSGGSSAVGKTTPSEVLDSIRTRYKDRITQLSEDQRIPLEYIDRALNLYVTQQGLKDKSPQEIEAYVPWVFSSLRKSWEEEEISPDESDAQRRERQRQPPPRRRPDPPSSSR